MGVQIVTGAQLQCSFGLAPSNLAVTSQFTVLAAGKPAATIQDNQFPINIPPFGMCNSPTNPVYIAANAKPGPPTPVACTMTPVGNWVPGNAAVIIGGKPCLCTGSTLTCGQGMGTITIINPGQTKVMT